MMSCENSGGRGVAVVVIGAGAVATVLPTATTKS